MALSTLEKDFWSMLKRGTKKLVDWQRIESPTTGRGIPDLDGCAFGIQAWVELKVIQAGRVKLSPYQVSWLTRRGKAKNGNCWVLGYRDHQDWDEVYLWHGRDAGKVLSEGVDAPYIGRWKRPSKNKAFPWGQIVKIIFAQ